MAHSRAKAIVAALGTALANSAGTVVFIARGHWLLASSSLVLALCCLAIVGFVIVENSEHSGAQGETSMRFNPLALIATAVAIASWYITIALVVFVYFVPADGVVWILEGKKYILGHWMYWLLILTTSNTLSAFSAPVTWQSRDAMSSKFGFACMFLIDVLIFVAELRQKFGLPAMTELEFNLLITISIFSLLDLANNMGERRRFTRIKKDLENALATIAELRARLSGMPPARPGTASASPAQSYAPVPSEFPAGEHLVTERRRIVYEFYYLDADGNERPYAPRYVEQGGAVIDHQSGSGGV